MLSPATWCGGVDASGRPHGHGVLIYLTFFGGIHEGVMESGHRQGEWVERSHDGMTRLLDSYQCVDDIMQKTKVRKGPTPAMGYVVGAMLSSPANSRRPHAPARRAQTRSAGR